MRPKSIAFHLNVQTIFDFQFCITLYFAFHFHVFDFLLLVISFEKHVFSVHKRESETIQLDREAHF